MKSKKEMLQDRLNSYEHNNDALKTIKPNGSLLTISRQNRELKYMKHILPENVVENAPYVDTPKHKCLNSPANLIACMHNNSELFKTSLKIIDEGLLKTYPTALFLKEFGKLVSSEIPDDLKHLKFTDVGLHDYGTEDIFMATDRSSETNGVSNQIAVLVPIYAKDEKRFNAWLNDNIGKLYAYGYALTSIEKLSHDLLQHIDILIVQFEAIC